MFKKLLFLTVLILLTGLAGNVSAIEWVATDEFGPPADTLWSTITNWNLGRVPDDTDSTTYIGWRSSVDANYICLIDGSVTAECGGTLFLGKQAGSGRWASLDITGGTLDTGTGNFAGTFNIAYWGGENAFVTMSNGVLTIGNGGGLQIGNGNGSFDLTGGTINIGEGGRLNVRSPGLLNVAGGSVVLDSNDPSLRDHKAEIEAMYFDGEIRAYDTRGVINIGVVYPLPIAEPNYSVTTLTATYKPKMAWGPEPDIAETGVDRYKVLEWEAGDLSPAALIQYIVYCSNNLAAVEGRTAPSYPAGSNSVSVAQMTIGETYYWAVDTVDTTFTVRPGENIWHFTVEDGIVSNPNPTDTASTDANPTMTWTPGAGVVTHDVYLSDDWGDVNDRNPDCLTVRSANNYTPGGLELSKTYYWAVDEDNDDGTLSSGPIWSFTTYDYFILDDFESYSNKSEILQKWSESDPTETKMYLYHNINNVHSGNVSVKIALANIFSPYYEYIYREGINVPTDITLKGTGAYLSLWFAGHEGSQQEKVYVKLEDDANSFVIAYPNNVSPDLTAIVDANWHEWRIALSEFTNVDLTNIQRFTLGIGDELNPTPTLGQSIVYFDDIEVHPRACLLSSEADITGDCVVDWYDVEIMADDWLMTDQHHIIIPAPPPNDCPITPTAPGLVAHYTLNEPFGIRVPWEPWNYNFPDAIDASCNHDGIMYSAVNPPIVTGRQGTHYYTDHQDNDYKGGAITIDPSSGLTYIDCGSSSGSNDPNWADFTDTNAFTVATWVRPNYHQSDGPNFGSIITKGDEGAWALQRHWQSWNISFYVDVPGMPWGGLSSNPAPYNGLDGILLTGPVNVFDGGWHHAVGTFEVIDENNSRACLYIDGILDASIDLDGSPMGTNDYDVWIGSNSALGGGRSWWGDIDDVRIYNYALSAEQVCHLSKDAPNLVACYEFEGNADDSSGHGHHGTLMDGASIVWDEGSYVKPASWVLDVGDANGYVNCGSSSGSSDPNWADYYHDESKSLSIAAWVCPNSLNDWQLQSAVVSKGSDNGPVSGHAWALQKDRGNSAFSFYLSAVGLDEGVSLGMPGSGNDNLWDDQWHHIAVTWNNAERHMYIDGELDASDSVAPGDHELVNLSDWDVLIGANPYDVAASGTGFRYWKGLIDDVRIYKFALSHAEVIQTMMGEYTPCLPPPLPAFSEANLWDKEPLDNQIVNFRDYAVLAESWLTDTLWPQP